MSTKVCALRASKEHPHVYSRNELEHLVASRFQLPKSEIKLLSKKQLCERLGIPFHDKKQKKVLSKSQKTTLPPPAVKKICTRKRSVPRYTLEELQILAMKKHLLAPKDVSKYNYLRLCQLLKLPIDTSLGQKKKSTVKKSQALPVSSEVPPSGNCVNRCSRVLKTHQLSVVKYLRDHRGLIAFHKVGSGKTLTAITASQCYLDEHPTHRVLIIAPAGLLGQFRQEMTQKYINLRHPTQYEFYSYQKFTSLAKSKTPVNCYQTMVIIDEGHNLRNPKGVNTLHVLDCTRNAEKVLILTGTPIYNSTVDIVSLYNMIRDPEEPEIRPTFFGPKQFRQLLCKISYHDTKGDPHFPSREDHYEYIDMSKDYKKKYEEVVDTILGDKESEFVKTIFGGKDLVPFFNAVRRAVNNLDNTDRNRKLEWVVRHLRQSPKIEKTVVFSNFLSAGIHLITKRLPHGIPYGVIEGKVPMKIRQQIVQDFNNDKIQVLFISKAGGEGLDMKGVRQVILMEPTWNESSLEQVIGRAIRYQSHAHLPKNEQKVKVYHLLHIVPADRSKIPRVESYLRRMKANPDSKELGDPPISPYESSFDLYLDFFLKEKQVRLDRYNDQLRNFSIERNKC